MKLTKLQSNLYDSSCILHSENPIQMGDSCIARMIICKKICCMFVITSRTLSSGGRAPDQIAAA
jgi:hypothetical protein